MGKVMEAWFCMHISTTTGNIGAARANKWSPWCLWLFNIVGGDVCGLWICVIGCERFEVCVNTVFWVGFSPLRAWRSYLSPSARPYSDCPCWYVSEDVLGACVPCVWVCWNVVAKFSASPCRLGFDVVFVMVRKGFFLYSTSALTIVYVLSMAMYKPWIWWCPCRGSHFNITFCDLSKYGRVLLISFAGWLCRQ